MQAEQETFARGYVDRIVAVTRRAAETLADRWFLYDSEIPAGATNGARELLWMSFLQGVRDGVILICQDRPGLSESSRAALTKIALDAACDRAMRLNAAPATGGRA